MNPNLPDSYPLRQLADTLNIKTLAGHNALKVALENVMLLDAKQQDYGPGNITGYGLLGVVVRMNDKFERIKHMFGAGRRRRALNESIRDSFRDISNYAVIALLLDANKWPSHEPDLPN